jgi:hypothetical protein
MQGLVSDVRRGAPASCHAGARDDADQRVVFERCAPRVSEAVERLRALVGDEGEVTTGEPPASLRRVRGGTRGRRHASRAGGVGSDRGGAHAGAGSACLSEAMALGVDEVEGIRCAVRDPSPRVEDRLVEAVDAARRKAEGRARAAERPLGGIVAVEEQSRDAWTMTCARSSSWAPPRPGRRTAVAPSELSLAASVPWRSRSVRRERDAPTERPDADLEPLYWLTVNW